MDTPFHSTPVKNSPPASGRTVAAAATAEEVRAADPTTDLAGPPSSLAERSAADVRQRPSAEPQGEADVAETTVAAERRPAPPSGNAGRDDPSEGNAEAAGGEAAATAFDPAAFDEALRHVLSSAGGELLFRFTDESAAGDKIAAVRLGDGDGKLVALVILPPHGAPLRVEPAEESANPLASLAKSYASLVDAWKAAA